MVKPYLRRQRYFAPYEEATALMGSRAVAMWTWAANGRPSRPTRTCGAASPAPTSTTAPGNRSVSLATGRRSPLCHLRRPAAVPAALRDGHRWPRAERAWLVLDGIFYQSDVWLDGSYLGDTEGYFFPHSFDVTSAVNARSEHVLAVEVGCERRARAADDALPARGVRQLGRHRPGAQPRRHMGAGPGRPQRAGADISLRAICTEAGPQAGRARPLRRARQLGADHGGAAHPGERPGRRGAGAPWSTSASPWRWGPNRVRWQVEVLDPRLWWPVGLGDQVLHDIDVEVEVEGGRSDGKVLRTGLRQVRMHNFVWTVNGERLFLKGANLLPTRPDLAYATAAEVAAGRGPGPRRGAQPAAGAQPRGPPRALRRGRPLGHAHLAGHAACRARSRALVARPSARRRRRSTFSATTRRIVVWCGHNEPVLHQFSPGRAAPGRVGPPGRAGRAGRRTSAGGRPGRSLPSWNRTVLDHSVRRTLREGGPVPARGGPLGPVAPPGVGHGQPPLLRLAPRCVARPVTGGGGVAGRRPLRQ